MSDTQEPIRLLGESRDMYYVIYDQVGEVKKTWAGTDQYEASSYAYGLIKKKDYWNNKADYIPVDVIAVSYTHLDVYKRQDFRRTYKNGIAER